MPTLVCLTGLFMKHAVDIHYTHNTKDYFDVIYHDNANTSSYCPPLIYDPPTKESDSSEDCAQCVRTGGV